MKALASLMLALALAAFLPTPAAAQQSSSVTIALNVPEDVLTEDAMLSFTGTVTLTADYTGALSTSGIPVTYTITNAPEWATVIVSPASDVFPAPSTPQFGLAYTASRVITITVTAAHALAEDASGKIEILATTTPGPLGHEAKGSGSVPLVYDAPDEPCHDELVANADLAALAAEAATLYNEYQASNAETKSEDVSVQNTGASTVPVIPAAVAGFGLVGAGIGLALRKRFSG